MREQKIIDIRLIKPRKEKRLINIEKPLQSKESILVKKSGKKYIIINGHHRYYKNLELNKKNIKIIVKNA